MISFISLLNVLSLVSAAPLIEERAVDGISHAGVLESGQDLVDQGLGRPCLQWSLNWANYPKSECYYWSTLDNRDYDTRFWRFKKDWTGSDDQVAAMESLERGAVAALDVYSKFADVRNIKFRIVLTTDDLGPDTLAVTNPGVFESGQPNWQWCAIRIQLPAASGNRDADLQQVVAHEVYHCIAFAKPNSQQSGSHHGPSQWWLEGGPEFFADQVAPPGQSPTLPYGLIGEYRPASPLYKQDYAAAIIFQFLNNQGWSDQRIDEFLGQQHYLGDEAAMLNDLYASELAPIFPDFAKALLDSEIYYTAPGPFKGRKVRPDYDSFFPHNTWSVASGTTAMLTAATEPFGINRYTLRVGPKESIVLRFQASSECQNRCVLNYRRQGTKSWAALTDTTLANCEDGEIYYDFLFTYTGKDVQAGAGGRQIQIQATKTDLRKRQETCDPQPAPSVDPNRCLIGKWEMDLVNTIPVLTERLETNLRAPGSTAEVWGMTITGSATCDIDENFNNHWVYSQMQMSWFMTGSSIPPTHTLLNIQGEMSAKLVFSEQNKVLTWKEQRSSVSAKSLVFTSVIPEPLEFDFPLFGNSGATVEVEYECAGDRMTMTGRMGGQYIYTWILKKIS